MFLILSTSEVNWEFYCQWTLIQKRNMYIKSSKKIVTISQMLTLSSTEHCYKRQCQSVMDIHNYSDYFIQP